MELTVKPKTLRAVPAQIISCENGVVLKRGVLEVHIEGDRASEVIESLYLAVAEGDATREQLVALFPRPDQSAVEDLIERLIERRLFVYSEDESARDDPDDPVAVFYWNLGYRVNEVKRHLNERKISILGVNHITRQLVLTLAASGVDAVTVVDYPLLRNLLLFDADETLRADRWCNTDPMEFEEWKEQLSGETVECIVAASDFGGAHWMRQWNEVCVKNKLHFLPIVLQNLIGYLGPAVIPGETACYECLRARQNSHLQNVELYRAPELVAFWGQEIVSFHPAMASILGDIGAIELTKLYSGAIPRRNVGTLIEVNMLLPAITLRKVLKVPRCSVCGPTVSRAPTAASRSTFLPGN
jgi:bacteriocin biosynthesis cyclodehydratase domain-containing protein